MAEDPGAGCLPDSTELFTRLQDDRRPLASPVLLAVEDGLEGSESSGPSADDAYSFVKHVGLERYRGRPGPRDSVASPTCSGSFFSPSHVQIHPVSSHRKCLSSVASGLIHMISSRTHPRRTPILAHTYPNVLCPRKPTLAIRGPLHSHRLPAATTMRLRSTRITSHL